MPRSQHSLSHRRIRRNVFLPSKPQIPTVSKTSWLGSLGLINSKIALVLYLTRIARKTVLARVAQSSSRSSDGLYFLLLVKVSLPNNNKTHTQHTLNFPLSYHHMYHFSLTQILYISAHRNLYLCTYKYRSYDPVSW